MSSNLTVPTIFSVIFLNEVLHPLHFKIVNHSNGLMVYVASSMPYIIRGAGQNLSGAPVIGVMHIMRNPKRLLCWMAIFVLLFAGVRTQGMPLPTYDLDSLIYMGPEVVEGALGGTHVTNHYSVWEFKVSAVFRGSFKVGQSVNVTALDFFRVSTNGFFGNKPLEKGDQLFLFLAHASNTMFYDIHTNDEIYWPAPSGVRLFNNGRALRFQQYMNPGQYLAVLKEAATTKTPSPAIDEFRRQIRESIPRVDSWRPILDRKPASNDIPALLEILRQRLSAEKHIWVRDAITEEVCQTLADLHDTEALLKAAQVSGPRRDLSAGFETPAGREFLRKHIANDREPVKRKVLCANLLAGAGKGTPAEWHLKHMAELAAQSKQNQNLQVALVQSMRSIARWPQFMEGGTNGNSTNAEGSKQAGAILVRLAKETESEELKYYIDLVLPELGFSPFSSNNCLLQLNRYDVATRTLHMKCRISGREATAPLPVALVNVKTHQKWNAPSNLHFQGDEIESSADAVVPKDLPHGLYRVFYEFMENGKVKSTSHYFEVDL